MFSRSRPKTNPSLRAEPSAVVLSEWHEPPLMSGPAADPALMSDEENLLLAYRANGGDFAVVRFLDLDQFTFGYPNDEALGGHPLFKNGLRPYTFYEVGHSPRIAAMDAANRITFPDSIVFSRSRHWIVAFKDSMLEVVANKARYAGMVTADSAHQAIARHLAES